MSYKSLVVVQITTSSKLQGWHLVERHIAILTDLIHQHEPPWVMPPHLRQQVHHEGPIWGVDGNVTRINLTNCCSEKKMQWTKTFGFIGKSLNHSNQKGNLFHTWKHGSTWHKPAAMPSSHGSIPEGYAANHCLLANPKDPSSVEYPSGFWQSEIHSGLGDNILQQAISSLTAISQWEK